jgi:hypothetical protein
VCGVCRRVQRARSALHAVSHKARRPPGGQVLPRYVECHPAGMCVCVCVFVSVCTHTKFVCACTQSRHTHAVYTVHNIDSHTQYTHACTKHTSTHTFTYVHTHTHTHTHTHICAHTQGFYVETPCHSIARPGKIMAGTRITLLQKGASSKHVSIVCVCLCQY